MKKCGCREEVMNRLKHQKPARLSEGYDKIITNKDEFTCLSIHANGTANSSNSLHLTIEDIEATPCITLQMCNIGPLIRVKLLC